MASGNSESCDASRKRAFLHRDPLGRIECRGVIGGIRNSPFRSRCCLVGERVGVQFGETSSQIDHDVSSIHLNSWPDGEKRNP